MAERVTIQDIADALNLSRNTVSKAINNTGILADSTREKVLQKAVEMGYKQFTYMNVADINLSAAEDATPDFQGEIALLTCAKIDTSHFSATMLDKFQKEISKLGYSFTMHRVTSENRHNLTLPNSFRKDHTKGILCLETFNYDFSQMICSMGIPTLFVDSPVLTGQPLPTDCLIMDNRNEIMSFVREMKQRGKTKIGFIGDSLHCQSFFERYMAYREAMYLNGLPIIEEYCLTENVPDNDGFITDQYPTYLMTKIKNLKELPEVFICANDFVAIDLLQILRQLKVPVPDDVWLCGFDDSPESRIVTPPLTTIHIHCEIMGISAVQLLLSRIKEPSLNYRTTYTETTLVYRESTGD